MRRPIKKPPDAGVKFGHFSTRSNSVVVATRFDKLAATYLAFIQLASIRLWLHANEPTP